MTEIVIAILASSGIWGLLQALISRKDKTTEKLDGIMKAVTEISDRVDRQQATQARTHILRFDDELISNMHHSKEYFQQILEDIDIYERYCANHPDYKNNSCVLAIAHIRRVYGNLQDNGGF